MHIVLTNDDGYDAPGLRALHQAAARLGNVRLQVIAPAKPWSGQGHCVSEQVACRQADFPDFESLTVVEGTPADCARMSLFLPGQSRPDCLIAGINRGGNLGVDIYYSGTVAAAREAAILGIPAIAISQYVKSGIPDNWTLAAYQAAALIAALLRPEAGCPENADPRVFALTRQILHDNTTSQAHCPPRGFWNINLPRLSGDEPPRHVALVPPSVDPLHLKYETAGSDGPSQVLHNRGDYHQRPATPETDVAVTFAGGIAISRISL